MSFPLKTLMNKIIIALNWKQTQTIESAQALLLKTVEDVNIYPDYSWIIFPEMS